MPNYAILVDVRDRHKGDTTYIPEENIEILNGVEVGHSLSMTSVLVITPHA